MYFVVLTLFSFCLEKYYCIEVFNFWTENLLHPDTHCEIRHPDVGKYFKEFTGQYYVMNSEKAQEYPDDDVKTRTTVEGRGQWEIESVSYIRNNQREGVSVVSAKSGIIEERGIERLCQLHAWREGASRGVQRPVNSNNLLTLTSLWLHFQFQMIQGR